MNWGIGTFSVGRESPRADGLFNQSPAKHYAEEGKI